MSSEPAVLVLGSLVVDAAGNHITFGSQTAQLSSAACRLLAMLVENRHRVVSRAELAAALGLRWERSVDVLVMKVRRAIGEDAVRTVRGRGWMIDGGALGAEASAGAQA